MVTTRQQSSGKAGFARESLGERVNSEDSKKLERPQTEGHSASCRGQDESTPAPPSKRQEELPVRKKDEQSHIRRTNIAVEILVEDITRDNTSVWTTPNQGRSRAKRAAAEDLATSNPAVQGADNQNGERSEDGRGLSSAAPGTMKGDIVASRSPEKLAEEWEEINKASDELHKNRILTLKPSKTVDIFNIPKPKHKRFGSEEPAAEDFNFAGEEDHKGKEEDESSDDDTPEVVGKQDAYRMVAHGAMEAADDLIEFLRQSRKAAGRKRKRDGEKEKEEEKSEEKKEGHSTSVLPDAIDTPMKNEMRQEPHTPAPPKKDLILPKPRTKISKSHLPEFLPAEYLEDGPDNSSPSIIQTTEHKSKKIKFVDSKPRKPKDRKNGSTIYRVAEAHNNDLLAPKATITARLMKEALLNGRGDARRSRRPINAGFFKPRP